MIDDKMKDFIVVNEGKLGGYRKVEIFVFQW